MKIVELFPIIIQSIFSMGCLMLVSKSRFKIKTTTIMSSIFMVVLIGVNTLLYYLIESFNLENYNLLTIFLPQAIFVSCISKRKPLSSLIASLTAYLVIYAVQLTKDVFTNKYDFPFFNYLHIFSFPLIFLYLRKIYVQLHNEIEEVLPKLLYYLLIFEIILYAEFFVYGFLINTTILPVLRLEIFVVATTSIYFVAIAILYLMINEYKKYMITKNDSIVLKQAVNNLEEIMKMREIKENQLRILRHDLRHVLITVDSLIKNGESDEAIAVIQNYISTIETTTTKRYSTIPMIDSILEYYSVICEEKNIKFNTNLINFEEAIKISNSELTIFISNCLENAINGTSKLDAGRYINMNFINNMGRLILQIENSFTGDIETDDNNKPISSLKGHGIGTNSIHWFAERNNLSITYNITDTVFKISVLFKEE